MRHTKKPKGKRILREQLPSRSEIAKFAPKSIYYRKNLMHLIGKTVTIRGTYDGDRKRWCGRRIGYIRMICLRDVTILNDTDQKQTTDHIWLNLVNKNTITGQPLQEGCSVDATGILYEYIHNKKRNIGLRVISCKNTKNEIKKEVLNYGE